MVFWQIFALIFSTAAGFFLWRHQQAVLKSEKGVSTDVQQTEQIQGLQRRVAALEGVLSEMRTEIARALDGQETYQGPIRTEECCLVCCMPAPILQGLSNASSKRPKGRVRTMPNTSFKILHDTDNVSEKDKFRVLLAEDSLSDAKFVLRAIRQSGIPTTLYHVENGEACIAFLRDDKNPRPDLVLLDLRMPRMDGFEVLEEVKTDADLRRIVVVAFTSSKLPVDLKKAYDRYVNSYVPKPLRPGNYRGIVEETLRFFRDTSEVSP